MMLGIVGCAMFADEIVHAIERDPDISMIYLIANADSDALKRKIEAVPQHPSVVMVERGQLRHLRDGPFSLLICMEPIALHEDPPHLREEVSKALAELTGACSSILLFYGLCGNAFRDIQGLEERVGCPITIIADESGRAVDDCVAAVLGGTDGYLGLLRRYPGVFYLTPAWAENWRDMMFKMEITRGVDRNDLSMIKWLFDTAGYELALKIPTGLGDQETFDRNVADFAKAFNFDIGELEKEKVTLDCIERSYERAKGRLSLR